MSATLQQLVFVRSQLADGLWAFYRSVIDQLDRTPWYRNGAILRASSVVVPARVLKECTRPEPEPKDGPERCAERGESKGPHQVDPEIAALYEQPVMEKRREEVCWEQERRIFQRAVIVGAPGAGKTLLTQTTALAVAESGLEQLAQRSALFEELPLPVWLDLDTLGQDRRPRDLLDAVVGMIRELYDASPHLESWLRQGMPRNTCSLILDALDQVKRENRARLRERLEAVATHGWLCRVVATCRMANYDRASIPWDRVTEYELAPFGSRETADFIGRWYRGEDPRGTKLRTVVETSFALQYACQTPLVTTLACLANEEKELTDHTTRGQLYEQVLRGLLRRAWRRNPLDQRDPHVDDMLEMLESAAWELFLASPAVNQFYNTQLKTAIRTRAVSAGLSVRVTDLRDELLDDGVLVGAGVSEENENQYSLLHRSFLEYLVARHMGRLTNERGWEKAVIPVEGGRQVMLRMVVDQKAWLMEWREVLVLLAGTLKDPVPMIEMLKSAERDDLFRHRLAIAVQCLGEVRDYRACRGLINEVTTEVWRCYRAHTEAESGRVWATIEHLVQALPALAQAKGAMEPQMVLGARGQATARVELVEHLVTCLQSSESGLRSCAARALGALGPAGARAEVVNQLIARLQDPNEFVRHAATEVLGRMSTAGHPRVLEGLLKTLCENDIFARQAAAAALANVGAGAARHPGLIDQLRAALRDHDRYVRSKAAESLAGMGEGAARHPGLIDNLTEVLRDEDWDVRQWAVLALGGIGEYGADQAGVIAGLLEALRDQESIVRDRAAEALGRLGESAAAHPGVIDQLLKDLRCQEWEVRRSAAKALGRMGESAARYPGVLDGLLEAVRDQNQHRLNPFLRGDAADALGRMGESAARHPGVLDSLMEALRDQIIPLHDDAVAALGMMRESAARHPGVLERLVEGALKGGITFTGMIAARALETIGESAAQHPGILKRLLEAFRDDDGEAHHQASYVLGRMGESAGRYPGVLDCLMGALRDQYWPQTAAEALGRIGESAARYPGVLDCLMEALGDDDFNVRRSAAEALGSMGESAARYPSVLDRLFQALSDQDWAARQHAAVALRDFASLGVRLFRGDDDRIVVRWVDDLAGVC